MLLPYRPEINWGSALDEKANRTAMRPEGGYVDLHLTHEGGRRMVFA